jgi:hypothetical protein
VSHLGCRASSGLGRHGSRLPEQYFGALLATVARHADFEGKALIDLGLERLAPALA